MDRYVIKAPRNGASAGNGYPTGMQVNSYSEPQPNMVPEAMFYGNAYPNMQQQHIGMNMNPGFMRVMHANTFPQQGFPQMAHNQGQAISGIDPNYLSAYATNNAAYIASEERPPLMNMSPSFGHNYENRLPMGADRNKSNFNLNTSIGSINDTRSREMVVKNSPIQLPGNKFNSENYNRKSNVLSEAIPEQATNAPTANATKIKEAMPEEVKVMSRADKIKVLHKSGPRAFSGPVEKVLKWHKALQEIGPLVIYEIVGYLGTKKTMGGFVNLENFVNFVAKCVSVRPGESCAKHLVVRDAGGPAMQVVYYEIDFLLPELQPGCTVRIVGKMMAGTSRFQAFNVRPATGDDIAMLPRRAAVAMHHVAKLCKEYGVNF